MDATADWPRARNIDSLNGKPQQRERNRTNILEVLSTQRKGKCLIEAQTKLQELVKTCLLTGKKGMITIKLEVEASEDSTVVIGDDISLKLPKPSVSRSVFYADEQGALFRDDPKQPEFPEVARMDEASGQ